MEQELNAVAEKVFMDFLTKRPSIVKLLQMSYKPLVEQGLLMRLRIGEDDSSLATIFEQILGHLGYAFDSNFILKVLVPEYSSWFRIDYELLNLLKELNIEVGIFSHVVNELLHAIRYTIRHEVSLTPKKTKKFGMNAYIQPFALEFYYTRGFRSLSSYLEVLEERMYSVLKKFKINILPTEGFNLEEKEVHYLANCLHRNFGKNKVSSVQDARSILAIRKLNKQKAPVFIKINEVNVPFTYHPVKFVTCDISSLLVSFPNETIDPLEVIYQLDDVYRVLYKKLPFYEKLIQVLKNDFDRELRIRRYVLNSLNLKVRERIEGYKDFYENRSWLMPICFGFEP